MPIPLRTFPFLPALWRQAQQNACGLAQRNYPSRIVGFLFLSALSLETYYIYHSTLSLLVAGIFLLFWPHLAFFGASRSRNTSKRYEYFNIYIDSALGGCLIALFNFSVLEMQAILFSLCANNMSLGGARLFLRGLVAIVAGIASGLIVTNMKFVPFAGIPTAATAVIFVFLYVTVTNFIYYKRAQSLIQQKIELEILNG